MEYSLKAVSAHGLSSGVVETLRKLGLHIKDHIVPHARNSYQPHVLHHRALGLFSLLLLSVKVSVIAVTALTSPDVAFSSAITQENIFSLTNDSRQEAGVPALRYNETLARAAQAKANDMLEKGYFAHTSPEGKSPWEFIKGAGYSYITAGENLAWGFPKDCAECVEEAWMNSPGHKANIVNKHFEEIGIGIVQGTYEGYNSTFVVQMFGTPLAPNIAVKNEPTPVAKPAPVSQPEVAAPAPAPAPRPAAALTPVEQTPVVTAQAKEDGPEELKILKHTVAVQNGFVNVNVQTSASVTKTVATFSGKSVLLKAVEGGNWQALIPLSLIGNSSVSVVAYDISGGSVSEQVANFTTDLATSYGTTGDVKGQSVTLWGKTFDPKAIEYQFYLMFAAAVMTCMIIAIAVHRHVQHVPMIANSSFVVVLAMLLLVG